MRRPGETAAVKKAGMVGADGALTLALSAALIVASAGLTFAAALLFAASQALRTHPAADAALRTVVAGGRLGPDGAIPPRYRRRLDHARARAGHAERCEIVILGGQTRRGLPTEAAKGAAYLAAAGIPLDTIRLEGTSRHTLENLWLYRAGFADARTTPVALVTNRFHLARCGLMAAGLGLAVRLCPAEDRATFLLEDAPRLLHEAFLIHWFVSGRALARLMGHRGMLARIS